MRIKLGLLSTVIALCLGQAYSAEVQSEVKQTQEKDLDVNKSIRKCKDILKYIVNATKELSESNIELLEMLRDDTFEGIDAFIKTNTENTEKFLLLESKILEVEKTLNEIADTYIDSNLYEIEKINILYNKVKGIAEEFKICTTTLKRLLRFSRQMKINSNLK